MNSAKYFQEKIGSQLEEYKKPLAFGLGVALLIGFGYLTLKRTSKKTQKAMSRVNSNVSIDEYPDRKNSLTELKSGHTTPGVFTPKLQTMRSLEGGIASSFLKMESYHFYKTQVLVKMSQENLEENMLSRDLLLMLSDCFVVSFLGKFKEMTDRNRKERRAFLAAKSREAFRNYEKICLDELDEFDAGMQEVTLKVLNDVNIDPSNYYSSLKYHMAVDHDFHVKFMLMHEKLKVANREKKVNISFATGCLIIQREIELMKGEDRRIDKTLEEEARAPIKQILATDTIFEEFLVEEEDLLLSQVENEWDQSPEYMALVRKLHSYV